MFTISVNFLWNLNNKYAQSSHFHYLTVVDVGLYPPLQLERIVLVFCASRQLNALEFNHMSKDIDETKSAFNFLTYFLQELTRGFVMMRLFW